MILLRNQQQIIVSIIDTDLQELNSFSKEIWKLKAYFFHFIKNLKLKY